MDLLADAEHRGEAGVSGAATGASRYNPAMTNSDVVRALFDAWNAHDVERAAQYMDRLEVVMQLGMKLVPGDGTQAAGLRTRDDDADGHRQRRAAESLRHE
jgi:hypothetical protein